MQDKSQSSDFASSTGITAKIGSMFCDHIVWNRFVYETYYNCFHTLRFHSNKKDNSSTGIA